MLKIARYHVLIHLRRAITSYSSSLDLKIIHRCYRFSHLGASHVVEFSKTADVKPPRD